MQACHRQTRLPAALKFIDIEDDDCMADCLIEIAILSECGSHKNIVGLHEAFLYEHKLWVSMAKNARECATPV